MNLIGEKFVQQYLRVINPIIGWFVKINIHPNTVTWAGLVLTFVAANFYRIGSFVLGGIFLVLAGTCDVLDGQIARRTDRKNKFGAFFDSTVDRYSDIIIFLGLAIYFDKLYIYVLVILAISGSLLTSYARARAGALGVDCKVGLMQRPERITYVAGATIFDGIVGWFFELLFGVEHLLVIAVLWFVAVISNVTVLQRVVYVKRQLESLNNRTQA